MQSGVVKLTLDDTDVLEQIRQHWLSNLAHNLSGPLFTARGYVQMALQAPDAPLSEIHKRYLTLALENIARLGALAQNLEEFPSLHDFEFQSFGLREALIDAITDIVPCLQGKGAQLRQNLSDGPMTTVGDRKKLEQALGGFLAAAARAVEPRGALEISAAEADGLITIRLSASTASPIRDFQPDISIASRLWRSHGGSTSALQAQRQYSLTCELPVIRFQ